MTWTTEDRCLLQLLFTPEEARPFLSGGKPEILPPGAAALDGLRLLDTARWEGVAALLFRNIRKHRLEDLFPEPVHRGFSDAYHINLRRNMAIIGKLRPVLSEFRNKGISCIVLKGIALAECVYPDIAVRGMSDVDLLIRKDDLLEADRLLLSLGYDSCDSSAAEALRNPVGYLASVEYRGAKSPFHLHVHWHPVNTSV
ncbi:MAG: nucleotidyltransferase family protein, partial [Syntrophales bacterium]|nr:nucleotidyltransferase family protein [Syntrophales bacterium]